MNESLAPLTKKIKKVLGIVRRGEGRGTRVASRTRNITKQKLDQTGQRNTQDKQRTSKRRERQDAKKITQGRPIKSYARKP